MEDNKNMNNGTVNENTDKKGSENTTGHPANKDEKEGVLKKVGGFFKRNGKKIGVGLGIAAAFAGGIAADKIGLPFGKKEDQDQTEEQ